MKKFVAITLGIIGVICASCSKDAMQNYSASMWEGSYMILSENGASAGSSGLIRLNFNSGEDKCSIEINGPEDLYSPDTGTMEVRWAGIGIFYLYPTQGEQLMKLYTGTIVRRKMTLRGTNFDGVETIYKLTRID